MNVYLPVVQAHKVNCHQGAIGRWPLHHIRHENYKLLIARTMNAITLFFQQRSFFLKLNATDVRSCHMKRIPRPRLVQFWNIWEITPEVRRRGGKQRMGKYGNIQLFHRHTAAAQFLWWCIFLIAYLWTNISVFFYLWLQKVWYLDVFAHRFVQFGKAV